jgi:superfamily II DNA or RNA helicase
VHRTGSKEYSKAFWKTGAKYTIGLSATPVRADGLTKVIKWFLGDILVKISRKANSSIVVKKFDYESTDQLFVEKKRCIKGKVKPDIIKMTTNMYKIKSRNIFIINILNALRKQENRKIMVLSGRIEHLKILKEGIDAIIKKDEENGLLDKDEIRTSFYIGGMKEYELNDSAEADIIFGTYEMAQEGLDIDSLNTLVMATPKKNIIQSIGRIMRKPLERGDMSPLIVDIADMLSNFKKWSCLRTAYYSKNNYNVKTYFGLDNDCVNAKEYMMAKKLATADDKKDDYIKGFICYKYDETQYNIEMENGIDYGEYEYDSNLERMFAENACVEKNEDVGYNVEVW